MADGTKKKKVDKNYEYKEIARERSIWLLKPITLVLIVIWCFYPSKDMMQTLDANVMLGFLLGSVAGIIVKFSDLKYYLYTRRKNTVERKNRMPDEYYYGKIKKVLFGSEE